MQTLNNYTDTEWRALSAEYPRDYGGYWPGEEGFLRVGIGQSRDSDVLEQSNYIAAFNALRDAARDAGLDPDEAVQEHRASHWAVGWVESLWVADYAALRDTVRDLHAALANYPVLDEDDFCEREHEALSEIHDDIMRDAFGYTASRVDLEDIADSFDDDDRAAIRWAVIEYIERDWTPSPDDVSYTPYIDRTHAILRGGRTDVEV